ncbi:pilus assembly protein PilC, partial [Candidatus Saccharibacteria bacterium]
MKKFSYEARDIKSNKVVKATVQAESERAAAKTLMSQGFNPLSIKEESNGDSFLKKILGKINSKDKVIFLRQLSTLIGAGLPLAQSLRTVAEQTENKNLRAIVEEIVADVEGGHSLVDAFSKHDEVFDKTVLALIEAGEASGTLDKALKRIAVQKEKDAAMMGKVRGAMVYPSIVLVVIIGVLLFMLLTIVPEVEKLYKDMDRTLPLITQIMTSATNFILNYWWLVLIILGAFLYFLRQYLKTDSGIKVIDTLKLNVPLF